MKVHEATPDAFVVAEQALVPSTKIVTVAPGTADVGLPGTATFTLNVTVDPGLNFAPLTGLIGVAVKAGGAVTAEASKATPISAQATRAMDNVPGKFVGDVTPDVDHSALVHPITKSMGSAVE